MASAGPAVRLARLNGSAESLGARAGLVPPAAALYLLGRGGAILMVIMLFMAVTSSGSAELVAVSSLFTYDVYRTYINPNATGAHLARSPAVNLIFQAWHRLGASAANFAVRFTLANLVASALYNHVQH